MHLLIVYNDLLYKDMDKFLYPIHYQQKICFTKEKTTLLLFRTHIYG